MRFALLALVVAAPLAAQPFGPSNTEGLFVQLALDGQSLDYSDDNIDNADGGGGLALRLGYGFSPVFTLYGGLSGAGIDGGDNPVAGGDYAFAASEIGARFHFNRGSDLRPYLDLALRGVVADLEDRNAEFRGGGFALGGGLAYYVSPTVALDAALRVGGGTFTDLDLGLISLGLGDDVGYGEGRLSVGVTAYPFR